MCTDLECRLTEEIGWQLNDMLEGYNDEIDIEDDVYLIEMVAQLFKERHSQEGKYYKREYAEKMKSKLLEELGDWIEDKD